MSRYLFISEIFKSMNNCFVHFKYKKKTIRCILHLEMEMNKIKLKLCNKISRTRK